MQHQPKEVSVSDTQNISRMCLVCGEENPLSLHAQFLNLDDGRLCAKFQGSDVHQSYPGRMHGGMISAILDECIGRAVQVSHPEVFGVTLELTVRYRKPVPLNQMLTVIAEVTEHRSRLFIGQGKLLLDDGTVAADATARYYQLDVDNIADGGLTAEDWHPDSRESPDSLVV